MQLHFNYMGKGKVAKDLVAMPFEWRSENALQQVFEIYGSMDSRDGRDEGLVRFSRKDERRPSSPSRSTDRVDYFDDQCFRKLR